MMYRNLWGKKPFGIYSNWRKGAGDISSYLIIHSMWAAPEKKYNLELSSF
jgi:hypothetical protein